MPSSYKRVAEDLTTEEGGVIQGRGHESRHTGGLHRLEESGRQVFPKSHGRKCSPVDNLTLAQWDHALQTSGLQNCEIINWHCL